MRYMFLTGHSVAGLVCSHNKNYFVPEEDEYGSKRFFYDFKYNNETYKLPIFPFDRNGKESVFVYEYLNSLQPDIIMTIGDVADFPYMHAVKSFYTGQFKWLSILTHYNDPINDDYHQVVQDMTGIMCTSMFGRSSVESIYHGEFLDCCLIGANPQIYNITDDKPLSETAKIMSCAKTIQADCAPTIMESIADIQKEMPIEMYLHSNISDDGRDHDLATLRLRLDPEKNLIRFPDKYVSILDGCSETEMADEMRKADIFISIPMIAGSAMSVFQSLACGCWPVLSEAGINVELAKMLSSYLGSEFTKEDFLVPSIRLMAAGDTHLYVCSKNALSEKIMTAYKKLKKYEGLRKRFSEFTKQHNQGKFLEAVNGMATSIMESKAKISLENVRS